MIRKTLIGLLIAATAAVPAAAGWPLRPNEVRIEPGVGYILARLGPEGADAVVLHRYRRTAVGVAVVRIHHAPSEHKEYDAAMIGGSRKLADDGRASTYLIAVRPGHWLFAAVRNTVFSLGTYGFDVRPGEVTDVGTILVGREDGLSPIPEIAASKLSQDLIDYGTTLKLVMSHALLLRPVTAQDTVPPILAGAPIVPAAFEADIRFPNIYGSLVNRALGLPPMEHIPIASSLRR